jgi:hypothetical protein
MYPYNYLPVCRYSSEKLEKSRGWKLILPVPSLLCCCLGYFSMWLFVLDLGMQKGVRAVQYYLSRAVTA